MIEMLGVLAIIGVLSAGGIWAYSAAMESYRANKTIEDITDMIAGVVNVFGVKVGPSWKWVGAHDLARLGIVPKEYMVNVLTCDEARQWPTCYLKSRFGTRAEVVYLEGHTSSKHNLFYVYLYELSPSACAKLLKHNWFSTSNLMISGKYGYVTLYDSSGKMTHEKNLTSSSFTNAELVKHCQSVNHIRWIFYIK